MVLKDILVALIGIAMGAGGDGLHPILCDLCPACIHFAG